MRAARGHPSLTAGGLARRVESSQSQNDKFETGRASPETLLKVAMVRELGIATCEVGV